MIGPHEGKELDLMLSGEKHLALFHDIVPANGIISEDIIPEQKFKPHVDRGSLQRFEKNYERQGKIIRYVCYTTPGHEWRAHAFFTFLEDALAGIRPFDDHYEYFVGRLLGYSEDDIADYLNNLAFHRTVRA